MRKKYAKRALMAVLVGTLCQFGVGGGCLQFFGQAVVAGAGFATGQAIGDALGLGNLIPGLGG